MIERRKSAARTRTTGGTPLKKGLSFGTLCEAWYKAEILGGGVSKPTNYRGVLDRYLLPELGARAAAEITPKDITRLLDGVKLQYPSTANQMLRITRRVFTFAVRRGNVSFNPTFDLTHRQDAGGTDRERTRALTVEELAKLFAALRDTPRLATENALALQLLVALGVRKGELVAARWEEFDLKGKTARGPVWHLPADRSLNGEPLEIPLAPPVIQWLQMLRGLAGNSEWVFPGRRAGGKSLTGHVAGQTLNAALSGVEHGLEHFTVDDLRRTTRKQLTALGVRREVVEKCLGHRYRDRGGTYDETDYFEERRAALEKWAEVLQRAEEEKGARQRKV